jgi:G3E family GTPase
MSGHFSALLGTAPAPDGRICVLVLTGFLGSGKTTLLNRLLREPDLHGTAVIINEFGQVGIDHDLVAHSTEDTVLLANGCMCCAVRGDLVEALVRLAQRDGPPLQRVLIETSGLADPGPVLRTLMSEGSVRDRFVLACVACTVDAVLGLATLQRHGEASRQVAVADALFLTKTDLQSAPAALLANLQSLNPDAVLYADMAMHAQLLRGLLQVRRDMAAELPPSYRPHAQRRSNTQDEGIHDHGIRSFVIERDQPLPQAGFAAWMDMVVAMRGEDLLRVKGLVHLAEQPDQPVLIHGVQHLFHPPQSLAAWPSADHRTRIVFITRGVDAEALGETLDVLARRHRLRPPAIAPSLPHSEDIRTIQETP